MWGLEVKECGFKTIQCGSLQIKKGIVDLGFSILKKVLSVPKVQLALKDEGSEFLGVRTIQWMVSQSFSLAKVVLDLTSLLIGLVNTVASLLMVFIVVFLLVVLPGGSLSTGLMCADLAGAD